MIASSSAEKWRFSSIATASSIWAVLLAPISTDVTDSWRKIHASAICDSFWPRLYASAFS